MECLGYINNGNLAEWAQVILSTIGMGFIIWTLLAQLRVTRLEQKKFIQANIPLFKMQILKGERGDSILKMAIDDNHVKEYKINIVRNPCNIEVIGIEIYNAHGLVKNSFVDWALSIPNEAYNKPSLDQGIELNVYYMDIYGYTYCQIINVFIDGGNVSFPPKPIGRNLNLALHAKKPR